MSTLSKKENARKKSRFSEEQIIEILVEQESGMKVSEVRRKHGMSDTTFYKWKSKFGDMEGPDAKVAQRSETENTGFKKMVAELSLDKSALEALFEKVLKLCERRKAAYTVQTEGVSQRRAYTLAGQPRTT